MLASGKDRDVLPRTPGEPLASLGLSPDWAQDMEMGWDKGTDDSYNFLKTGEFLTLVEFRAPWCAVCKQQSLIVEQIARKCPWGVEIQRIDIEDDPARAIAMGIQSVPTLIVYKHGEEVLRLIGLQDLDKMRCILRDYLDSEKKGLF